jgi:hypothetical protein
MIWGNENRIMFVFGVIPTITIHLGSDYDSVVRIEILY